MTKKSQITAYVIIGLVILIVIGLVLFIVNRVDQAQPDNIPKQIQPVKQYVEQCLYNTGKEGLKKLGSQGGYIYPEDAGIYSIPDMPTSSSALEFAPGTELYLPFWYYMSTSNACTKCSFLSKAPLINKPESPASVEYQLGKYIEENIEQCLDFTVFAGKFLIAKKGETSADVTVTETGVDIVLQYPINIKYMNTDNTLNSFQASMDVKLKDMFEIADSIIALESTQGTNTFSRMTKEMIAVYSSGNNPALPPMYGPTEFEFKTPRHWIMDDVKIEIENILVQNVPVLQIEGSKGSRVYNADNQWSRGIYSNFLLALPEIAPEKLNEINVNFLYLDWWPIYLDITPRKGNIIWPESLINTFILPFSITRYDFVYDVSYPIVGVIRDDKAFKGEGFTMQFAFEVNLRNNDPLSGELVGLDQNMASKSLFQTQLRTNDITIKTKNSITGGALEDVMVLYNCLDETVFIGMTKAFAMDASLVSKFPTCTGGLLVLQKTGFIEKSMPLDLVEDESREIETALDPILKKNMIVKKKIVKKEFLNGIVPVWKLVPGIVQDVHPDDQIIVILERKKSSPQDTDFVKYYEFSGTSQQEIELTTGLFRIESFVIRKFGEGYSMQKFVIPEKEFCYDKSPLNPLSGEECQTIEAVVFNQSIYLGGVLFDESTGFVNITTEDLAKGTMTLYVAANNLIDFTQIDDLGQLDKVPEHSRTYRSELLPRFS